MATQTNSTGIGTFQTVLYGGALHPELFELRSRRVTRLQDYELEAWLMDGAHAVRLVQGNFCCLELVLDEHAEAPRGSGQVAAVPCQGESEYEHLFKDAGVNYINTAQSETLSENLYRATLEEMDDFVGEVGAMHHRWHDGVGPCLSLLHIECLNREAQIQGFHLMARGGVVLRTQTILEREYDAS